MSTLVSVNGAQREAGLYAGVDGAVRVLAGGGECFDWIVTGEIQLKPERKAVISTPGMANFAFFTGVDNGNYFESTFVQMANTSMPEEIRVIDGDLSETPHMITYQETRVTISAEGYNCTIIYFIGHKRE